MAAKSRWRRHTKGRSVSRKTRPGRQIAGARPRLDEGRAFPCAAHAFIVAFGRAHRQAHRGDRRVGAQPKIGAEHVPVGGMVRQQRAQLAGDADEGGARFLIRVLGEGCLVEQADQVDIRGIIQFPRAHLAHRQNHHACNRSRRLPLSCPAVCGGGFHRPQARSTRYAWRGSARSLSAPVTWSSDQTPPRSASAAKQRHAALGPAQARGQVGQGAVGQAVELGGAGASGAGQRVGQPVAFAQDQRFQIGAAPGRAREHIGRCLRAGPARRAGPRPRFGIIRDRRAGDGTKMHARPCRAPCAASIHSSHSNEGILCRTRCANMPAACRRRDFFLA